MKPAHSPVSLAEYHRDRSAISASHLKLFARNRWRYRQWRLGRIDDPEPTPQVQLGTAAHVLLFQPEQFAELVAVVPAGRTKAATEARDAAAVSGKAIISDEQQETARAMIEAVHRCPAAERLVSQPGRVEHAVFWHDELTGLPCKCSFDLLTDAGVVVDLKTTSCESAEELRRDAEKYGWHLQAAWYSWARDLYVGAPIAQPEHYFLVVPTKPPYEPSVYQLGQRSFDKGQREISRLLAEIELMESVSDDESSAAWMPDGYYEPAELDLPEWALR